MPIAEATPAKKGLEKTEKTYMTALVVRKTENKRRLRGTGKTKKAMPKAKKLEEAVLARKKLEGAKKIKRLALAVRDLGEGEKQKS